MSNGEAVDGQTLFRWASISKSITGVVAAKLAQAGTLDLDRNVVELVPEFPKKQYPVSARQLLAHLSFVCPQREVGRRVDVQHRRQQPPRSWPRNHESSARRTVRRTKAFDSCIKTESGRPWFNGGPAVLLMESGLPVSAFPFGIANGMIVGIFVQRNPDKLDALRKAMIKSAASPDR